MFPDLLPGTFAVKICGVRDVPTAEAAVRAGASAVGVALAPSRRRVSAETAASIGEAIRGLKAHTALVGLTVNEGAGSLHAIVERSGVDVVQLSGDESPDVLDDLTVPAIKSIRIRDGSSVESARRSIEPWLEYRHPVALILLDAHVDGQYGGTGHRADWDVAAVLVERYPVMLAGGLTAANVAEAIRLVRPLGVDVSSGVETDGAKDHAKIRGFVDAARAEAFANATG